MRAPFVSDDRLAIVNNDRVVGPFQPWSILTTFSWWGPERGDAPGYRPMVTASFALDHAVAGLEPVWYHAMNFVWHALVSTLVYGLAVRLGATPKAGLIAAVAFCLLPIHSEAVIWPVGRAELMAAGGFLGALLLLLDFRRTGGAWRVWTGGLVFSVALFAKENAATLLAAPFLAALLLPTTAECRRRDAITTAVLLLFLALYVGTRSAAGPLIGSLAGDQLDNPLSALPFVERLLASLAVLGRYLALTIWPHPLSIDYSYDALSIRPGFRGDRFAFFAIAACLAMAAAAWPTRRRVPVIAYGLLLAAATYSIVSNTVLLIGTAMAERLFYLPSLGLCIAAAPALETVWSRGQRRGRVLLFAAGAACVCVLLVRATEWRTPVSIFEAAARAYPRSARAQMEVAGAYGHEGRFDEAVAAFRRATEIMPSYAAAWYNLGNLYARRGEFARAEPPYRTALAHAPKLNAARYNLGLVLLSTGRASEAVEVLRPGMDQNPGDPALAMTLADTYFTLGRNAEAADAYAHVLAAEPGADDARLRRGIALQRTSGCEAALIEYRELLRAQPGERTALAQAVECLNSLGRAGEAEKLLERARVANRTSGR